jgi:SAM-dependent methyltransferase
MSQIPRPSFRDQPDWDAKYREGTPPWDTGVPSAELVRVLEEGWIRPCSVLELGCGSGADAVYLAKRKFDVTAVEWSPTALERARTRAELVGASICFVLDDVYEFGKTAGAFDFVYDAGFYHYARQVSLDRFLDLLWRVTRPGSYYLTLAGAKSDEAPGGPPQVSQEEIHWELCRLFQVVQIRPFRFQSPLCPGGYPGWSCLMKRPEVKELATG